MNKAKKLIVFSCCIIIAAFAALWVGCKNQIWLEAEETGTSETPEIIEAPPTVTITSVEKGTAVEDVEQPMYDEDGVPVTGDDGEQQYETIQVTYDTVDVTAELCGIDTTTYKTFGGNIVFNNDSAEMSAVAILEQTDGTTPVIVTSTAKKKQGEMPEKFYVYAGVSSKEKTDEGTVGSGEVLNMFANIVDQDGKLVVDETSEYTGEEQFASTDVNVNPNYDNFLALTNRQLEIKYTKIDDESKTVKDYIPEDAIEVGRYKVYGTMAGYSYDEEGNIKLSGIWPLGYLTIVPKDLSTIASISFDKDQADYSGKKFEPKVKSVTYNRTKLVEEAEITEKIELAEGTDYDVVYPEDMVSVGTKSITVNFKGNYTGSKTARVTISPKDLTNEELSIEMKEERVEYSGETWTPEITEVKLGDTILKESTDYKVILPEDMVSEGKKDITIEFIGNYTGKHIVVGEILSTGWGKAVVDGDHRYWVDNDGTTSARIVKGERIWLKETSDGSSAWYGIDNTNNTFQEGSRFWVKWLGKEENKDEWNEYYEKLDDEHKNKVEDKKLWIFLCGVTDPEGNEYKEIATPTNLYIQLGSDWDKDDIQAVFISDAIDEPVESIEYINDFKDSPTGTGDYAKLKLKHFSPYAVYDELTDEEREMLDKILNGDISEDELNDMIADAELDEPTVPDNDDALSNFESSEPSLSYITGDQRGYIIIIAVSALIVAGITLLISLKNKKNK